jgi:ABC-type phosphate/phosphonate transport system substrate-binding protein
MKHQSWWKSGLYLTLLVAIAACAAPATTTTAPAASSAAVAPAESVTDTVAAPVTETAVISETAAVSESATEIDRTGWPESFRLGFFGGDDAEAVMEGNAPLAALFEEKLGIPVEMFTGTSYTAVIEAMRADRVDAMEVGPFSYTLAVQEARAEALAVGISSSAEPAVYDPSPLITTA